MKFCFKRPVNDVSIYLSRLFFLRCNAFQRMTKLAMYPNNAPKITT